MGKDKARLWPPKVDREWIILCHNERTGCDLTGWAMNAFNSLQYAKARLLLAQRKNDATEIEKWQERVAYWQRIYKEQKQQRLI